VTPLALLRSAGAILVPSLLFALASVLFVLAVTWVSRRRARRGGARVGGAHRKPRGPLEHLVAPAAWAVAAAIRIPVLPAEVAAVARDISRSL
jgi:hypothetical protein